MMCRYLKCNIFPVLVCSLLSMCPLVGVAQECNHILPETAPTSQFIDHENGTVTDTSTRLMWKKCLEGQTGHEIGCTSSGNYIALTWSDALLHAQEINKTGGFAGYTNWRLPNIKELQSIVELQCRTPALNLEVFPAAGAVSVVWSSTPYKSTNPLSYKDEAWYLYFHLGDSNAGKTDGTRAIRLVRDL